MGKRIAAGALALSAIAILASCSGGNGETDESVQPGYQAGDTLRVATLYSPSSYFIYRDEPMGYDYAMLAKFAQDKGLVLDLKVARSLQNLIELLDSAEVDLLAYEIPLTAEFKAKIVPCGPESQSYQVLVQPKKKAGDPDSLFISDETQLIGRAVYVESNSKYEYRLRNLDGELGGGILIHTIDRDTLITEDLIEMVSDGQLPLTVADSDLARLTRTYHSNLDASLPLSFAQKASWGASPEKTWLADSINEWLADDNMQARKAELMRRYFELSKTPEGYSYLIDFSKGKISPFDHLFRKYASLAGEDWRLLAAQGYWESRFNSERVSWAGARGIMQIMPSTARAYGLEMDMIADPEANIRTAATIMKALDKSLSRKVDDATERRKFVIAAYNSGIAHIYDAIALAAKHGKNPQVWDGNVEQALLWKANPEYYSDSVCRAGYFRGRETVAYVRNVMELYEKTKQHIKN